MRDEFINEDSLVDLANGRVPSGIAWPHVRLMADEILMLREMYESQKEVIELLKKADSMARELLELRAEVAKLREACDCPCQNEQECEDERGNEVYEMCECCSLRTSIRQGNHEST